MLNNQIQVNDVNKWQSVNWTRQTIIPLT